MFNKETKMISNTEENKVVERKAVKDAIRVGKPTQADIYFRNSQVISPADFYNHKTKTFKKNQRKGL